MQSDARTSERRTDQEADTNDSRSSTARPPLATIDENANPQQRRRPRLTNSERLAKAVLNGSDQELVESIVGFVQQDVVEIDENERQKTTETAATSLVTTQKRSYEYTKRSETVGNHTIENIPSNLQLILGNRLSRLEREAAEGRRLKAAVSHGKFCWNARASHILGCDISQIPQASQYAAERALPLFYRALFEEADVCIDDDTNGTFRPVFRVRSIALY